MVIGGDELDGGNLAKPLALFFDEVADGDELGLDRILVENEPASEGARDFAAHQAAADDADAGGRFHLALPRNFDAALEAVKPSWTMLMSARVMPRGCRAG